MNWNKFLLQVVVSTVLMVAILILFNSFTKNFMNLSGFNQIKNLTLIIGSGFIVYAFSLFVLGLRMKDLHA